MVDIRTETTGWLSAPGSQRSFARDHITRLIRSGEYDEVIWLLAARRRAAGGDPEQLAACDAVAQLCRTCLQLREQQREHLRSLRQAAQLEEVNRRRIERLLEPILRADETGQWVSARPAVLIPERLVRFQEMALRLVGAWRLRAGDEDAALDLGPYALLDEPDPDDGDAAVREPAAVAPAPVAVVAGVPAEPAAPAEPVAGARPDLRIYCLGQFRVFIGDRPVEAWTGHRSRCLLKYLLVRRRRPAHADQLLDVFWADSPPESARRSLYQTIYLLRQSLRLDGDRPAVVQADGGYMLNPDLDIWVDCEVFAEQYREGVAAAERGDAARAVAALLAAEGLYGGDFMSEEPYEDWPVARREEARDAYLDLLDRLGRHYATAGPDDLCVTYSHKLLDLDNGREDIHRRLMRLYARRGDRGRALRQYQRCVEALRAELDVDPLPETTDLYVKILNNTFRA